MAAIITSKFRFHNAEQFKESFSEAAATNYYLFIGRPGEFATGTTGGTDSAPPIPVDNRRSEAYHWDDMLAAKKIDSTGVTHAVPRRDLDVSGATTYDMYRPDYSTANAANSSATNLFDSTFYFMTSSYRVYKVLDNGGNIAWDAAEPTSTSSAPFSVAVTGGTYSLNRFLTVLNNRSDLSKTLKGQVASIVVQHANTATSNPDFTEATTADQAAGQMVSSPPVAYAEGVVTPFGADTTLTPALAGAAAGSQPLSGQSFNSTNVSIDARGVREQRGGFGGPTHIPSPLTPSELGIVRDASGNPPNKHIAQGVTLPRTGVRHSNGRSL